MYSDARVSTVSMVWLYLFSFCLPFFLSFFTHFYCLSILPYVTFLFYRIIVSTYLSGCLYLSTDLSLDETSMAFTISARIARIYIYPEQSWMLPLQPFWKASVLRSAWLFFDRVLHQTTTNLGDLQKFTEFHIFLTCSVCSFAILTM